jgi:hypothetical protein
MNMDIMLREFYATHSTFLILKKSGLVENGAVQDLYVRYRSNMGRVYYVSCHVI